MREFSTAAPITMIIIVNVVSGWLLLGLVCGSPSPELVAICWVDGPVVVISADSLVRCVESDNVVEGMASLLASLVVRGGSVHSK